MAAANQNSRYTSNLIQFFSWHHGRAYGRDHEFPAELLDEVEQAHILNYFKYLAFDTIDPNYNDNDLMVLCRHETLLFKKKSLSFFYRHHGLENKTIFPRLTEFLKLIQRMELRGKGKESTARRPTGHDEYEQLITTFENNRGGNNIKRYGLQSFAVLHAQYNDLDRSLANHATETRNHLEAIHGRLQQLQRTVTTNFNQLNRQQHRMLPLHQANVPVVRFHQGRGREQLAPNVQQNATLSATPKTLNELWTEWQFGIGGRKAARLFTERERGCKKSTFCRRKAFWDLMQHLIREGHTHDQACARIYQVYGENLPVTTILDRIIAHRRTKSSPLMHY